METLIVDLHIHSKHAMGTSNNMDLKNLEKYGRMKGVNVLGTGDFTHPKWIKELKENLTDNGKGLFFTKTGFPFILQTEISLVFTQGRGRRVHLVVLAPSFNVVDKITNYLLKHGRVDYDGRPIFKISCRDFVFSLKKIDERIEIIPAHIWTPYFGLLGSKSGFDTVKEAFLDMEPHINALETGLSSDPAMNRRLSQLDKYHMVSFSDLHGFWPWRMSREATIFRSFDSYDDLLKMIRTGDFQATIEVDPRYGKYHFDGHRNCNLCLSPKDTSYYGGICPKCGKKLTIGVEYRVEELADRPIDYIYKNQKPNFTLVPLSELIAAFLDKGVSTKAVWEVYDKIIDGTNEYDILLYMSKEDLLKRCDKKLVKVILDNRAGSIKVDPGFDGEYGVPLVFGKKAKKYKLPKKKQMGLVDY